VYVNFRQVLDLKTDTMTTTYTDRTGSVRVETETFVHRVHREIAAYRMTIRALRDVALEISPHLDRTPCTPVPAAETFSLDGATGWVLDYGDPNERVAQGLYAELNPPAAMQPLVAERRIGSMFDVRLRQGQVQTLTVLVSTAHGASPAAPMGKALQSAIAEGYEALRHSHVRAMAQIWNSFHIEAENPFIERKFRASLLYLLNGYREDLAWGGSATGLSSKPRWGGCVFWDTEFYMFPALLPLCPAIARNMVQYRYDLLDQARQNAATYGECGARFPWQSRRTGRPFGEGFEAERHVTTDVAYAAWWYGQSSGDREFMEQCGHPLMLECARNVASMMSFDPARKDYGILGVIPPDEHVWDHYAGGVINHSVMTNAYAAWLLQMAAALPGATSAEQSTWRTMAGTVRLPRDSTHNIFAEYEGYDGHPIKQADVGHLFFPLCVTHDSAEIRRNIRYYADREKETGLFLTHSPFVYAAAMSRAGDVSAVREYFQWSERTFVGPFDVPRESNYKTGVVVTGSGSFLGLMLYGVLGIENSSDTLTAHACVPEEIGRITLSGLNFRGHQYEVRAAPGQSAAVRQAAYNASL
jgi:trehalose/maltose hydrolase-like predicted phosphorylase